MDISRISHNGHRRQLLREFPDCRTARLNTKTKVIHDNRVKNGTIVVMHDLSDVRNFSDTHHVRN